MNLTIEQSEYDKAVEVLHAATAIYTAEPIVDQLLDKLDWPGENKRLVDPACGDGQFIVRALERLLTAGCTSSKDLQQLQGYEIHSGACNEARHRVAARLVKAGWENCQASFDSHRMILNRDFLTEGPTMQRGNSSRNVG